MQPFPELIANSANDLLAILHELLVFKIVWEKLFKTLSREKKLSSKEKKKSPRILYKYSVLRKCALKMSLEIILKQIQQNTHIHNWSLQTFSRDYDLASHATYVACALILFLSGGTYSLKFLTVFHGRFFQKSAEREYISFWYLTWHLNSGLASNKPTHYLLDYADFNFCSIKLEKSLSYKLMEKSTFYANILAVIKVPSSIVCLKSTNFEKKSFFH